MRFWPMDEGHTHARNATFESRKVCAQCTMPGLHTIGLVAFYVGKPRNGAPLNQCKIQ